jgi:ketosteroid isomerase-like protein
MLTETRDRESLMDLVTDDHVAVEYTCAGERYEGRDAIWDDEFSRWLGAFPDLDIQIHNVSRSDTIEFVEGVAFGTHTGPGPYKANGKPLEPTGRKIELPFVSIYTIRDGKASGTRHYWDDALIMQQLGVLDLDAALSAA